MDERCSGVTTITQLDWACRVDRRASVDIFCPRISRTTYHQGYVSWGRGSASTMKPQNTMPPGMSPRGKKQEKPQPPPANKGLRFGSPLGYILLLVLGFMLFKNVFQDAGVQRKS